MEQMPPNGFHKKSKVDPIVLVELRKAKRLVVEKEKPERARGQRKDFPGVHCRRKGITAQS
jgi:hypothetical protein